MFLLIRPTCRGRDLVSKQSVSKMLQRKSTVVERLHIADSERYVKILDKEENLRQLLMRDARGNTALHEAAALGNVVLANDLISFGCFVDARNHDLETPLICAAKCSKTGESMEKMIKLLLEVGANFLAEDKDKRRAVEYCIEKEDLKSAKLLRHVDGADGCQELLFDMLFFNDDLELFKSKYLKNTTISDYRDEYGHNLLHYSVTAGHVELTRYFLTCGCDVNAVSWVTGLTPLVYAAKSRRRKWKSVVIKLLLEAGADINQSDAHGYSPLHLCVKSTRGDTESVGLLVEAGIDVNCQRKLSRMATPLLIASQLGDVEIMLQLLQLGADPSLCSTDADDPLDSAVIALCSTAPDNRQIAQLHHNILELLLTCGANPNYFTRNRKSDHSVNAFMRILAVGDVRLVKLFLEHGADPRLVDECGRSGLHFAAQNPDSDVLELLLNCLGADCAKEMQRVFKDGFTVLHSAVEKKNLDSVRLLCEYGVDVNVAADTGETPLIYLLTYNSKGIFNLVELLLRYGADTAAKTATGHTTYQLALRLESPELAQLISRYALLKVIRQCYGSDGYSLSEIRNLNAETLQTRVEEPGIPDSYFIECVEELNRMQVLMFYGSISFLNILACSYSQLLKFVNNTKLVSVFKDISVLASLIKMPEFGSLIQERFYQAVTEIKTLNVAVDALKKLLPIRLDDLVVKKIIKYLSVGELKKLAQDQMVFLENYVFNPTVTNIPRKEKKIIIHYTD